MWSGFSRLAWFWHMFYFRFHSPYFVWKQTWLLQFSEWKSINNFLIYRATKITIYNKRPFTDSGMSSLNRFFHILASIYMDKTYKNGFLIMSAWWHFFFFLQDGIAFFAFQKDLWYWNLAGFSWTFVIYSLILILILVIEIYFN